MYPFFVTTAGVDSDDEKVMLMARCPGDRDFFPWGFITQEQRATLEVCGVFELGESRVE